MTEFKQNGLVLKEQDIGENDKLLTVLTERYGKVFVVSKGAKSVRNRHMTVSQVFAYGTYSLRKRGNYYYITDSDLLNNHYDLRSDIVKVSLAAYICDAVNDVAQEGNCEDDILKLTLNTLYAIEKDIKPLNVIKAAFEIRLASLCGFTPNISECSVCGTDAFSYAVFNLIDGDLTCEKCRNTFSPIAEMNAHFENGQAKPISVVSRDALRAVEYIISARSERFLSFTIPNEDMLTLCDFAEKFLLNQLERSFYSLEFYKTLI